jgi:hypothetical protein
MQTRWLKNLKESDKAPVKQQVKNAKPVLDRLAKLLEDDLEKSMRDMSSRNNFESPAWDNRMAHYLGEQTALRSILKLIDIEEK